MKSRHHRRRTRWGGSDPSPEYSPPDRVSPEEVSQWTGPPPDKYEPAENTVNTKTVLMPTQDQMEYYGDEVTDKYAQLAKKHFARNCKNYNKFSLFTVRSKANVAMCARQKEEYSRIMAPPQDGGARSKRRKRRSATRRHRRNRRRATQHRRNRRSGRR